MGKGLAKMGEGLDVEEKWRERVSGGSEPSLLPLRGDAFWP